MWLKKKLKELKLKKVRIYYRHSRGIEISNLGLKRDLRNLGLKKMLASK